MSYYEIAVPQVISTEYDMITDIDQNIAFIKPVSFDYQISRMLDSHFRSTESIVDDSSISGSQYR